MRQLNVLVVTSSLNYIVDDVMGVKETLSNIYVVD